jgi:predicted O-methyltransferase YrrM
VTIANKLAVERVCDSVRVSRAETRMTMHRIVMSLRNRARPLYYRRQAVREIVAVLRWPRIRSNAPDVAHLAAYTEWAWGPIQRDDALLLHALVRTVRPATLVEIGFLFGHSAFNFLRALDADARLYSFDVDPGCAYHAQLRCQHDPRFVFRNRSQDAITSDDVDGRSVDFVFLDGAHDLTINQATFERLLPLLSSDAIIVIHDTGGIHRSIMPPEHWTRDIPERWVGDWFEHQPDERAFVNWLLESYAEFSQIHLHSHRVFRHGMTLLQRTAALPRPRDN